MAAPRARSCARCLASLVLPVLLFSSLLCLYTRPPFIDIAVREEATAARKRLVVGRAAAGVEANAGVSVTSVAGAHASDDVAAVAEEYGDAGGVMTHAPPASRDADVTTDKVEVSGGIAASGDGDAKVVTDAPPASGDFAGAGAEVRTQEVRASDAAATAGGGGTNGEADDTVVFDFRPYVFVYKSGRVHRFHGTSTVPPGVDALTGVASKDVDVAGAAGVSARLYLPPKSRRGERRSKKKKKKLPVLLYFHGGAFVIESASSPLYHAFLNILVSKAGAVAVSVNYRLAPEHPLPAAYDDAWAALRWTVSNCLSGPEPWLAEHGDATRIFLAGDSAGGNIAHNLAVRAGAEERPLPGGAAVAGVVLLNPYFWGKEPVGSEPAERWARDGLEQTWALVCGGRFGVDDPHVNPLAAPPAAWRAMAGDRVLVTIAGSSGGPRKKF